MKGIVVFVVLAGLIGSPAVAQQRTVTINRHDSFSYHNKTAEHLGYATMGLTAFLALLDSGTGARQNGVPVPGYPNTQALVLAAPGARMAAWWPHRRLSSMAP